MAKYTPEQRAERAAARKAAKAAYIASLTPEQLAAIKAERAERRAQRNAERTQALISKLRKEMGLPEPPTWDELNGLIEGEQRHIAFNFLVYLQQLTRLTDNDYYKLTNDMATNSNGLSTPDTAPTTGGNPAPTYDQITAYIDLRTGGKRQPANVAHSVALIKKEPLLQRGLFLGSLGATIDTPALKVKGLSDKVARSPLFLATIHALATLQYQQSEQAGTTERRQTPKRGLAITDMGGIAYKTATDPHGTTFKYSSVGISLKELFTRVTNRPRPTEKEYQAFYQFLWALDKNTQVKVTIGNGLAQNIQAIEAPIVRLFHAIWPKGDTANKPQDCYLSIGLNPVFHDFTQGFARFPSDALQRLSSVTTKRIAAHYVLMNKLALWERNKPQTLNIIRELYEEMYLGEEFNKTPKRAEQRLLGVLDALQAIGQIQTYTTEKSIRNGSLRIVKAILTLNPLWGAKVTEPTTMAN